VPLETIGREFADDSEADVELSARIDYLKKHPPSSGQGREIYLQSDGSDIYVSEFGWTFLESSDCAASSSSLATVSFSRWSGSTMFAESSHRGCGR